MDGYRDGKMDRCVTKEVWKMVTVESRWDVFMYQLEKIFHFVECLEIFIIKSLGMYRANQNAHEV